MGVNSLPKTATRQRRDCDLKPGPSAPESSTLTTRLPSHPVKFTVADLKSDFDGLHECALGEDGLDVRVDGGTEHRARRPDRRRLEPTSRDRREVAREILCDDTHDALTLL